MPEGVMEEEARRVIDAAREQGVQLRVIGGLAVKLRCPSAEHRAISRTYGDLDLVGYRRQRPQTHQVMESLGYVPNWRFNTLQGHRRLLFERAETGHALDIFLDVFVMCHQLNFAGRLELDEYTVPLADLLLSKLQIVELNEKDVKDIYALVQDHGFGLGDDPEEIDIGFITKLCGSDWGWYRTVTWNIDKVLALAEDYLDEGEARERVVSRLHYLGQAIEEAPKSLKWKGRARLGQRVRWYDIPEEIEHS